MTWEKRLEHNPQTQELDEMTHGGNVNYTAVLVLKRCVQTRVMGVAVQHLLLTASNRSVVADDGLWIWYVAEDVYPDGTQVMG